MQIPQHQVAQAQRLEAINTQDGEENVDLSLDSPRWDNAGSEQESEGDEEEWVE